MVDIQYEGNLSYEKKTCDKAALKILDTFISFVNGNQEKQWLARV